MDDGKRQQSLIDQPVMNLEAIRPAHRNQEMKIIAAPTGAHPGAKSILSDIEWNTGKGRRHACTIEHSNDLVVRAEQALVQDPRLAGSPPKNDLAHVRSALMCCRHVPSCHCTHALASSQSVEGVGRGANR